MRTEFYLYGVTDKGEALIGKFHNSVGVIDAVNTFLADKPNGTRVKVYAVQPQLIQQITRQNSRNLAVNPKVQRTRDRREASR